jgi:hypothetical protein
LVINIFALCVFAPLRDTIYATFYPALASSLF